MSVGTLAELVERCAEQLAAALDAIGILADFVGVSVHDGWSSYWQFLCRRALCNVHHLRELTFLEEELRQARAGEKKELLLDIKAAVEQAPTEGRTSLHPLEVADWKARYGAGFPKAIRPIRRIRLQRPARKDSTNNWRLAICLLGYPSTKERCSPFWTTSPCLSPTSLAERDIRMVKWFCRGVKPQRKVLFPPCHLVLKEETRQVG